MRASLLRARGGITRSVAAAWTGALAAYVLGKFLEIALLFLRIFLRAHSRSHSVDAPGPDRFIPPPALMLVSLVACTPQGDPAIGSDGFTDDFDRKRLGPLWHNTGGPYRLDDGQLHVQGARNKPLWLERKLPRDVRIEFDARSESAEGDIKVEVFGDGVSHAETTSYTATSYVVIFGGWGNSKNVLARMDEHGADRVVGPAHKVVPGHTYRMKIEREGRTITAWADGTELARMDDPSPLWGRGHDHFAFNNWQADVWFDNLRITPL